MLTIQIMLNYIETEHSEEGFLRFVNSFSVIERGSLIYLRKFHVSSDTQTIKSALKSLFRSQKLKM
jgi:hypothetical protein